MESETLQEKRLAGAFCMHAIQNLMQNDVVSKIHNNKVKMPKRKSGSLLHVKMPKSEPLFLFAIFMLLVHFYVQLSGLIRNQFKLNVFFVSCFYSNEPQ